jgi:adenylylsulfate kinase
MLPVPIAGDTPPSPGTVFWITGLSGAGKSTVAAALRVELAAAGRSHVHLDGDALRAVFADMNRHDRASRIALARRYAGLCKLISDQGHDVVCSTISLFHEIHDWNRANLARYLEVFLDVDHETLRSRDPKGIYRGARSGAIKDVAGLDLAVEFPKAPDLTLRNDGRESPEQLARTILAANGGWAAPARAPERVR